MGVCGDGRVNGGCFKIGGLMGVCGVRRVDGGVWRWEG